MTDVQVTAHLSVGREELVEGLRLLRKLVSKRAKADIVLSYRDGLLAMETMGVASQVPATGTWGGQARLPAFGFIAFTKTLPKTQSIELSVEGDKLRIGPVRLSCVWQQDEVQLVELPLAAPLWMVLALRFRHPVEQIEASGLLRTLQNAEERREGIVERVVKMLEPLCVRESDIDSLVDSCIKRELDRRTEA